MVRYACDLNGASRWGEGYREHWPQQAFRPLAHRVGLLRCSICLTKLDVLDELETIRIGVAYRHDGTVLKSMPAAQSILTEVKVDYIEMPGWQQNTEVRLAVVVQIPPALAHPLGNRDRLRAADRTQGPFRSCLPTHKRTFARSRSCWQPQVCCTGAAPCLPARPRVACCSLRASDTLLSSLRGAIGSRSALGGRGSRTRGYGIRAGGSLKQARSV